MLSLTTWSTAKPAATTVADVKAGLQGLHRSLRESGWSSFSGFLDMRGRPVPPMEKTFYHALNPGLYLNDIAKKYGINLCGSGQQIQIMFDPDLPPGIYGRTREIDGGKIVRIGRSALMDEQTAANTIAHELSHARDYLRGGQHKLHGDSSSLADRTVYGSGNALEDYIRGNR